jgi:hypothetical protein
MKNRRYLPLLAALSATAAHADDAGTWTQAISEYGVRTAVGVGEARLGDDLLPARLTLTCGPGWDGSLSWQLGVIDADRFARFGLDDFEGPDAPANDKRQSHLALEGGLIATQFDTEQTGFWAENNIFAFEFSALSLDSSRAALLADAIGPTSTALVWSVRSLAEPSLTLDARFDLSTAASAIRATMMGCGPAPAIAPEALERWREEGSASLWNDRAMQWRLQGLLGRDYDRFATRDWGNTPLRTNGDRYYLLANAADGARDGAALIIDACGEVETIDVVDGKAKRHSTDKTGFKTPEPVRDYVARLSASGK